MMIILNYIQKTICISLIIFLSISLSYAEVGRKTPSLDSSETAGPYYNPLTKSYFELIKSRSGTGHSRWRHVNSFAQKRTFKNVTGHLAMVKDLATHQFILRHFKAPQPFWIGLQYFCSTEILKWVDGTIVTKASFTAWATKWARTNTHCAYRDYMSLSEKSQYYMPVSYTAKTPTKSLRWQATGPEKGYVYYLVEYSTGSE